MKKFTFFFVALFMSLTAFAADITATWSIEEGATLESFTEATITFIGVESATTTSMYPACFYKVAEDGTLALVENYCTAGVLDRTATGASIKLWVDEETGCYEGKITAGNYRIVLSAGMVKFNNDNSNKNTEEYVLNFSIAGSDEPALEEIDAVYTVNPENNANITEIREIVLNFTGYETIAVAEPDMVNGRNIPMVYFEDELTGSMMPAGYIMFKADSLSANGLRLYVDPMYTGGAESYAAEGKYAINIPAGVVTFSDGISKAITLNYTVKAEEVVEPTTPIVEGTKLYVQFPTTYSVLQSSVTFGKKATGGKLSPVKRGMSIGGGTIGGGTTTGTAMTKVDAENGVWEVVAPAGTSDSIFSVVFSMKGYTVACNIADLKYDGEHNLFTLSSDFTFDIRRGGTATEANGTWGVYPFPAPAITATWSIEEGAELESFTEATITFTGVDAATTTTMYPACFYKVAEDGTTALVENYCTAGVLDRTATGASIKLWVDEETGCYEGKITAGNYRIVLSAGMVKFNNDNSNKNTEEYVLNFSIAGSDEPALEEIDAVYTVNPENNANVTEIREIVLNFTGYETIAVAEPDMVNGRNIPTVYFEDELTGAMMPAGYIMFKADTASANGLRLYVDPAYTGGAESYVAEGKYAINIPAGVVTFSDGISKAITLNYTVKAEEVVEPTTPIVEGTKLYLKSYLGVASASSYEYKVVFGEFTVPSSGGGLKPGGGGLRPLAETATATEVAMTTVYTKEGKYNIWEVVAPAGTADSIFTIIISRRNAVQGYITPLKYDGVNNLFQLPDGFSFPRNTNVVNETAGEWGVYVEGVDPDPDPELVGNITAGLQFYFDFSANETWNALTGLKAKFTNSNGGTETVEMTQLADSTTWTVVVPEGLWQSFTVGTFKIMAPSINDLTYDGTNNLYTLDAEGNGTWSVYVEKTEPNVITATWSIEEGAELESFAGVTVTFSGVDSIGRKLDGVEVLKAIAQGSSTNALFYSVAEDGTRTPVAGGNGLMYASSKTEDGVISINYSVANKGYTLENDSYTVPGNYCFVIDAGDVLFTPNRSGLPKVYNDQEYVLNFSIKGSVAVVEAIDAQYSVDPENNTELTEIREVVVTFSEYDSIIVKETVSEGVNWLVCETEVTTEQGAMWTTVAPMKWEAVEGTLNALRIYVAADMFGEEAVTIEGAYRIIIPEGVVYFSETPEVTTYNKAITLNYTIIEESLPMEVEFENIAAIYEMGMWDMAYYESYSNYEVVALLKSQPTVVDKVVTSGMMGGSMNNYYLNDGTGVIVLQAEGDRYEPITDENWDVIGWDTIAGLNIEVGKKLPVDFMANIDFKTVTDEETWLPTGEVYGAPVMTFVPKATGDTIVDEDGWETIVTESNEEFVARCEASDFVEEAVEANIDDVLANRINYAGKLLTLNAEAKYYAESNPYMGTMSAYMFWNAEEAFEVESYEEEGTTVIYVSPKYTEDNNNFAGKLFNVNGEELPEAAFDANVTIDVVKARFDWNSIAQGQTLVVKEYEVKVPGDPVDVENGELVVNIYSNNGSVYVEAEAGAMIEVYTVNGLRVYAGVSNTNTTVINGLNTNIAIIRVNGETYKVFVK